MLVTTRAMFVSVDSTYHGGLPTVTDIVSKCLQVFNARMLYALNVLQSNMMTA